MNKKIKKIVFIVCSFLLAFFIIANVGSLITYSILFKRVKDIDYSITPGLINYELVKDTLPRKEYRYNSKGETLCGYFYKKLLKREIKSLLLVSTGALMSTTSSLQGESIPGIAHAVAIEYK